MTVFDKIAELRKNAGSYWGKRIAAELVYALKLSQAHEGAFDTTVRRAVDFLYSQYEKAGAVTSDAAREGEAMLAGLSGEAKKYTMHCVAHAHIDMNWMWSFQETVAITLDTFRTVLKFLDEYPQFTFSQSQASTYRIAEEYDPQMFEQIRKRVAENRWEVTASTWVEADKNMPSGESLARHILYTKRYFEEKFGLSSDRLKLDFEPDTFGHSRNVPEILAKGGVKYYYHCRGNIGHNIYNWRSPSGESVLVYREPVWYNETIEPDIIERVPGFCRENGIDIMLKIYGVGDHGGGPTRRDIERLIDMATWPVAPTIKFSTYHRFFEELERYRESFPVIDRELNYIFTGCYSSQFRIKQGNRVAEDTLCASEALSALSAYRANGDACTESFKKAWERVLFNHFHDIITGSGIRDTREHAMGRIQEALGYAHANTTKALHTIAGEIDTSGIAAEPDKLSISEGGGVGFHPDGSFNSMANGGYSLMLADRGSGKTRIFHLFNPTAFARDQTAEITVFDYLGDMARISIEDAEGNPVLFQASGHGDFWGHKYDKLLLSVKLEPFGYNTYVLREKPVSDYVIPKNEDIRVETYNENVLENEHIRAEFDSKMMLVSLTDKKIGQELIDGPSGFFKLVRQSHKIPTVMYGNAWVEGYETQAVNLNESGQVFITEHSYGGPLRQCIRYHLSFGRSRLSVEVSLDRGSSLLRYKVDCDWHELFSEEEGIPALKFAVPFAYCADQYKCEIPFGTIDRQETNHDVPSRGFIYGIPKEGCSGVALFTDCLYGYRGGKNALSVTLLRGSQDPDPCPEYGLSHVKIGVGICENSAMELCRLSAILAQDIPYVTNTSHKGTLPLSHSFLRAEGDVLVTAVKAPEDGGEGIVVRLANTLPAPAEGAVVLDKAVQKAELLDLVEKPCGIGAQVNGSSISLSFKPFEVKTVRVY